MSELKVRRAIARDQLRRPVAGENSFALPISSHFRHSSGFVDLA
jgi:hypothetical protein